jgi:hypothetical protein
VPLTPRSSNPPPKKHGLLWYLFRGPGHFAVYIAYKFLRRGQVLGSGRRWNDPFIEVFYSLLIYQCLAPFAFILWLGLTEKAPNHA